MSENQERLSEPTKKENDAYGDEVLSNILFTMKSKFWIRWSIRKINWNPSALQLQNKKLTKYQEARY
jgi:hypothetical protein